MDVIKIAINRDYGGFNISSEAYSFIAKRKGWTHAVDDYDCDYWIVDGEGGRTWAGDLNRDDPDLIQAIMTLGEAVNDRGDVKVVEVPSDVDWIICDYDGIEWIAERHRTWQ
jgi:hypothetical protein